MKILLSAYACEPNRGSEQGVGWGWATELAKNKDNEVWVLTRDRNKDRIETYQKEHPEFRFKNLHFIYVGVSKIITFWKKGNRGIRLYYKLWQKVAYKEAKKYHAKIKFDYVQHITFVSYTQPTYLYKLNIPFIWGPVSGGENIPEDIKIKLDIKEYIIERVRKASQSIALLFPSIRMTLKKSKLILVATEETKLKIPKKYWNKTLTLPAIGLEDKDYLRKEFSNSDKKKIIMAGRLIYWKAFDLGLEAFKNVAEKYGNIELHILGDGPKKDELKILAGKYLDKKIFFHDSIPHDEIYDFYNKFDLFLNTTLRDSGCMTMMEAMAVGLPCIVIGTGGPKVLAPSGKVAVITPEKRENTIKKIADQIECFINGTIKFNYNCDDISGLKFKYKTDFVRNVLNTMEHSND